MDTPAEQEISQRESTSITFKEDKEMDISPNFSHWGVFVCGKVTKRPGEIFHFVQPIEGFHEGVVHQ